MADAMEMMILSILGPQLHCEWRLPSWEVAFITSVSQCEVVHSNGDLNEQRGILHLKNKVGCKAGRQSCVKVGKLGECSWHGMTCSGVFF